VPNVVEVTVRSHDETKSGADSARRTTEGLKGHFKNVAASAAGMFSAQVIEKGVGAFKDMVGGAINSASDLNESMNAVQQVFGSQAQTIINWGNTNAQAYGLSKRAFNEAVTPMGAMLHNAGLSLQDTSKWSIDLTKRAADMASVFNTSVPDALEAMQAGLRGESDPLEKYGVSLSAAKVEAEALAETHKKSAKQLTSAELATARLNVIMKQTSSTQNDFKNTSGGLANATRIQEARMENLRATIGDKMMPVQKLFLQAQVALVTVIADRVVPVLSKVADWFQKNPAAMKAAGIIIGVVLVGAFVAWAASAATAAAATIAATWPVLAITAAVAALAAGFIYLYNHNETFRRGVIITVAAAKAGFQLLMQIFQGVVAWVREHWATISTILMVPVRIAVAYITIQWKIISTTLQVVVGWIREHWATIAAILMAPVRIAVTFITVQWKIIHTTLQAVIRLVLFLFRDLPNNIRSALGNLGSTLRDKGGELINGLLNGAKAVLSKLGQWAADIKNAIVGKIKDVFGIHSPSTVFAELGGHMMDGLLNGLSRADPMAFIKSIFGNVENALGGIVGKGWVALEKLPSKALSALSGLGGKLGGFLGNIFGAGGGGGGGGSGVQRWRSVAMQALAYTHMPASWIGSLLSRMQRESGGNPRAINNWDVNARRGDPSRGLMQTIMGTFVRYAGELAGRGIYDPFANIVASIRYANSAYGSAPRGWNRAGGYDRGGWLLPGTTVATNLTGRPEMVLTASDVDSLRSGGRLEVAGNADSLVGRFILQIIRQAVRTNGGGNVQRALGS
jgi:hypothetical protein